MTIFKEKKKRIIMEKGIIADIFMKIEKEMDEIRNIGNDGSGRKGLSGQEQGVNRTRERRLYVIIIIWKTIKNKRYNLLKIGWKLGFILYLICMINDHTDE